MESTTCPECTNEIDDGDGDRCPRCGAALGVAPQLPQVPPLMSVVAEPMPPASGPLLTMTRIMAVVFIGWLGALAVFSWIAFEQGYVSTLLPVWNTVFLICTIPVVVGVFARRMWAHRWTVGIAAFTGLGNAMQASKTGSTLLWIGAVLLGSVVLVLWQARPMFRHDNAHRGTVWQLIATAVMVGSIFVYFSTTTAKGTERGRTSFAAEVQQGYVKAGISGVRVYVEGKSLVIEGKSDTDEQIEQAAQLMHDQLRTTGSNAKAWMLGFENIKLTNGSSTRMLAPSDPP